MAEEKKLRKIPETSIEKGIMIISTLEQFLDHPKKQFGKIRKNLRHKIELTDEEGTKKKWDWFIQFNHELGKVFPGSYIHPHTFLKELGVNSENFPTITQEILGKKTGSLEDPTFLINESRNFSLKVINGMMNEYALQMTQLAAQATMTREGNWDKEGFKDKSHIRAQYQQAMFNNIKEALKPSRSKPAYRIHDDCLASGDSIMSYLFSKMQKKGELKKMRENGVEIIIDGPATAQGILFLKAFAQHSRFAIDIKVGHLAFGLSAGEKKRGVRKHANYITYPDEIMKLLDEGPEKSLIERSLYPDGNRYVVQDMGEAEKGILPREMKQIREELHDDNLALFNERRRDPHGDHKLHGTLTLPEHKEGQPVAVYLARGGYLAYQLDLDRSAIDGYNVEIMRVSRLWTKEYGYGAGFHMGEE